MQNVIMQSIVMQNVIMQSVVILSVVATLSHPHNKFQISQCRLQWNRCQCYKTFFVVADGETNKLEHLSGQVSSMLT
jgi:hypothetical protein